MMTTFMPSVRVSRIDPTMTDRPAAIPEGENSELTGGYVSPAAVRSQACGSAMWAHAHVFAGRR